MKNPARNFDAIESRAAAWLARRDGGMTSEEKAEFARWCATDPRHAAAVNEIDAAWAAFDRPSALGRAPLLRAELRALDRRDRRRWQTRSAALVFAAAASLAVYLGIQRPPTPIPSASFSVVATASVSRPETQTLPDGSVVEFRHGAEIALAFNEASRVVMLKNGEAHFSVTKNPSRPFIVVAGNVSVRAVGTAFAVQMSPEAVEVLVTEGEVSVAGPPSVDSPSVAGFVPGAPSSPLDTAATPLIVAGQRASVVFGDKVSVPEVASISDAELADRLSWRVPRLEFTETSIGEAVVLFARHSRIRLHAADSTVASMRVTGVFRSDNIEGFVRALETSLGLRADYRTDEIVLHRVK